MIANLSIPRQSFHSRKAVNISLPAINVHPWLRKLENIANAQLEQPHLKVADLGRSLFMSERQLFRRVKKMTGKTPNQYLQELRLKKAFLLLRQGKIESVQSIAYKVGFRNPHYFSCLFEKRFGVRPSEMLRD